MGITSNIQEKLKKEFQPIHLELVNESSRHHGPAEAESHFKLLMVSEVFQGLGRLERQRRVNEVLKVELAGVVHALTMKLFSREEWENLPEELRKFRAIGHHPSGKIED